MLFLTFTNAFKQLKTILKGYHSDCFISNVNAVSKFHFIRLDRHFIRLDRDLIRLDRHL